MGSSSVEPDFIQGFACKECGYGAVERRKLCPSCATPLSMVPARVSTRVMKLDESVKAYEPIVQPQPDYTHGGPSGPGGRPGMFNPRFRSNGPSSGEEQPRFSAHGGRWRRPENQEQASVEVEEEDEEDEEDTDEEEGAEDDLDDEDANTEPETLYHVDSVDVERIQTGVSCFDYVLGGDEDGKQGVVEGFVILVAGQPGAGKSTILRQTAAFMAHKGLKVLIVSAEESLRAVRLEFKRMRLFEKFPGAKKRISVIATASLDRVLEIIEEDEIDVLIFDSLAYARSRTIKSNVEFNATKFLMRRAHLEGEFSSCRPLTVFLSQHATKSDKMGGINKVLHAADGAVFAEFVDPLTGNPLDDQSRKKNAADNQGRLHIKIRVYVKMRMGNPAREGRLVMTKEKGVTQYDPATEGAAAPAAKSSAAKKRASKRPAKKLVKKR